MPYGLGEYATGGGLEALQQNNQMIAARPSRLRKRPVANFAWLKQNGADPLAGLGGVGGQYTPNMANAARVPSANAMMDPRQRNFRGGGGGRVGGLPNYAINPSGPAMQEMQNAGIGQVDQSTGVFLGNGAEGLMGNDRAQRVAGMIGRMPGAGPSEATLADNAAATAGRRWLDENRPGEEGGVPSRYDRRAMVRQRGIQNAEARRLRLGNLTAEERMQFGIPGFANEQVRMGGMRDVANIRAGADLGVANVQAGLGRDKIAADERVAEARNALDLAIASGNNRAILKAAKLKSKADADVAKYTSDSNEKVAGINAGPQQTMADASVRRNDIDMANQYRQAAESAARNGDWAGYQRNNQLADQMTQAATPGLAGGQAGGATGGVTGSFPQSWGQVPPQMRQQIAGASPEDMANNLHIQFPDMPQELMDQMLQQAYPGSHSTMYNPGGGIIGGNMSENANRVRYGLTGQGPKPPMIPGTNTPIMVMPGPPGQIQRWLGY